MLSYWERKHFIDKPDFCIVGSGIVGLTAAIFIKQQKPKSEVIVIEKGFLPDGASTKNAGFCCFGSVSELIDDMAKWPAETVLTLAVKRFHGLALLRKTVGDKNLSYEASGGYEIFTQKDTFDRYMEQSTSLNRVFEAEIGKLVYSNASHEIPGFGFSGIAGMIKNNYEGQVDTGNMMKSLLEMARSLGVKIYFGLEVTSFHDTGTNVDIHTQQAADFSCGKLLITTNGFAKKLLPLLDVKPARAQVLITKPVENLKFKGSFHYEQGYYYFRNIDGRVLFGGGRNLDFETEFTYEKGLTPLVQHKLEQLLRDIILPGQQFEIDMRWSGTMGVGSEKKTIVQPVSRNVLCGVRMGGMGVALGSLVGKELAELVNL
ncbi:MAG TPA: FAD-dependent oxidoreductase [Flavobacteriales bacterium]|nr:FAD-dependent oxidoreductase [Flavobacteriales bacterium]